MSFGRKYFECVDLHCGGEPARVLISGAPRLKGKSMAEKREEFIRNYDDLRKLLLQEPRGYPCQNLNIIYESSMDDVDFGYLICEQKSIYPLFSGHNTICVVTALLETGLVKMKEPETKFKLESPGGIIKITAKCENGRVLEVTMQSMQSFLGYQKKMVTVPGLDSPVLVDVAFGGMWYAIVDAASIGLELVPSEGRKIAKIGEMIKTATREQYPIDHPSMDYPGPDILVFTSEAERSGNTVSARNTVVMSNGRLEWDRPETHTAMLDRSPCGSGTAAVMAQKWAKGELNIGDNFVHESILGTNFIGRIIGHGERIGDFETIIPEISGRAFITGFNKIVLEADDPLQTGFTVGDIWA